MKKFGYVLAALGAIAVAAPSIASAETVVIKRGDRHHFSDRHHFGARAEFREHRDRGWHRGWRHHRARQGGDHQEASSRLLRTTRKWPRKGPFSFGPAYDTVILRGSPKWLVPQDDEPVQSHAGAKPGFTKRLSFGSAAMAFLSSSSSFSFSASRLACWLSARDAFGIAATPSWSSSHFSATCAALAPCLWPIAISVSSEAVRPCASGA